jgi:hypothetical protein
MGLLAALAAGAIAFVWLGLPIGSETSYSGPPPLTAVIVDQLSLTSPDQAFVDGATKTLRDAGYAVDYVPGKDVTVDFYRELPSQGYGLVIVRAHSGFVLRNPDDTHGPEDTFLFSSEPYSEDTHGGDQEKRRLSVAYYFNTGLESIDQTDPEALQKAFRDEPRYFGIKPGFIESSAHGRFPGTTVVLMGCNGLTTSALAKAFISKGARVVVGWDDLVSAGHTDAATEKLLGHLFVDRLSTKEAVARTASEVGPDPTYGGRLAYYE